MNAPDVVVSEITSDEIATGFFVRAVRNPDRPLPGTLATVDSLVHIRGVGRAHPSQPLCCRCPAADARGTDTPPCDVGPDS